MTDPRSFLPRFRFGLLCLLLATPLRAQESRSIFDAVSKFDLWSVVSQWVSPSGLSEADYRRLLQSILDRREVFAREYVGGNPGQRSLVVANARTFLFDSLVKQVLPAWYGTRWDFNGTTEVPRCGMIACGYFVSTTLRDVGFNVERARLGQQISEDIIKTLSDPGEIRRFSNVPIREFSEAILAMGRGLYVVGLDCHVGFLTHDGQKVRFVHSNYCFPPLVVSQDLEGSYPIAASKYRVVGRILTDRVVEKWITNSFIPTVHPQRGR